MIAIQSFDIFDTLIARRCIHPEAVHDIVEDRCGLAGIAAARRRADHVLHGMGRGYDLDCIYVLACRLLGQPVEQAEALAALEYEVELEQVMPIAENLARVRGDDLLISDMYLSESQIRGLLARAGAPLRNPMLLSNHGKSAGRVWAALQGRVAIEMHFGDNAHSDVTMPARVGIAGTLVQQHMPTRAEQRCMDAGLPALAQAMRCARLAGAHTGADAVLWHAACQLNFPLLALAALGLEAQAASLGAQRQVFFARDGNLWIDVQRALFPRRDCAYLACSRETFLSSDAAFDRYFDAVSGPSPLYADLFSTGSSFSSYLARRGRQGQLYVICRADDMSYRPTSAAERQYLTMHAAVLRSTVSRQAQMGLGLEMANFALHRRVRGVLELPGGHAPVYAEEREYDETRVALQHRAFRHGLAALHRDRFLAQAATADTASLMKSIYEELNGLLPLMACFPDHNAADRRYLVSLNRPGTPANAQAA